MSHDSQGQPLLFDVVSIQSQVVYGHVGNSVAVPTLEALAFRVAAVPTVLYSNTPHYASCHGGALPIDWFSGYLSDLKARGALAKIRAILIGYLGSPEQALVLSKWIREVRSEHSDVLVVVDPVIGDHDHGVYVAPGLVEAYRSELLTVAQGATPNSFELQTLLEQPIATLEETIAGARSMLSDSLQWLIVTSAALTAAPPDQVQVAVVTREYAHVVRHAHIDISPKGTGDLFAAALTGHLLAGYPLNEAAEWSCNQVLDVLNRTRRAESAELVIPTTLEI